MGSKENSRRKRDFRMYQMHFIEYAVISIVWFFPPEKTAGKWLREIEIH